MLSQNPVANVIRGRLLLVMILFVLLAGAALSGGPPPVAHAATITVDSATNAVADDGVCTLREAITAANSDTASGATPGECPAGSGADTIELALASPTPWTWWTTAPGVTPAYRL
jgi:CSLREA domain-containing protein